MDEVNPAVHAAAFWTAVHIILLLVLSVLVVRLRRRHRVALGDGGVPELERAMRAFGNATEYVPAGLAALAVLALAGASPLLVHLCGLMLFAGRVCHGVGLSQSRGASAPRAAGMLLTWLAYLATSVFLLFCAIP